MKVLFLFRVHKLILMARSPVFQAMLGSDMVEKSRGMIKIEVRGTNIDIYTNTNTE